MSSNTKSNVPIIISSSVSVIVILTLLAVGGYYYTTKINKSATSNPSSNTNNNGGGAAAPTTAPVTSGAATSALAPLPTATGSTTPAVVTPLAPVATPLTAQQKLVYGFTPAPNIDNNGGDIRCVTDGSDASVAREACANDSTCVAYNVIAPYGNGQFKNGGFCIKNSLNNIVAGSPSTLYAAPGALANPAIVSWSGLPGKDFVGSDINCWKNGEPLTVAQAACAKDPNCNAVAQVAAPWIGACTKTGVDVTKATNNSAVTLYVKPKITVG